MQAYSEAGSLKNIQTIAAPMKTTEKLLEAKEKWSKSSIHAVSRQDLVVSSP